MSRTQRDSWRSSPHANEFLPEEIERLERGTMQLCEECLDRVPSRGVRAWRLAR